MNVAFIEFVTLDGVSQRSGSAEEDTGGGGRRHTRAWARSA